MNLESLKGMSLTYAHQWRSRCFNDSEAMVERMRDSIVQEIESLHLQGWHVTNGEHGCDRLLRVARELSEARPHLLRTMCFAGALLLSVEPDVALALTVEAMCRQPHRLGYLNRRFHLHRQLSSRPVEDENYTLSLWMPVEKHPRSYRFLKITSERCFTATTLDDAHEAMLEAMDDGARTTRSVGFLGQPASDGRREPFSHQTKRHPSGRRAGIASPEVETTPKCVQPRRATEEKRSPPVTAPAKEQHTPSSTASKVDAVRLQRQR